MLRADESNVLTPTCHVRGDGTLAYYFECVLRARMPRARKEKGLRPQMGAPHAHASTALCAWLCRLEEMRRLLQDAGLEVRELSYCTVRNVNRKKGVSMDRVWMHAAAVRVR